MGGGYKNPILGQSQGVHEGGVADGGLGGGVTPLQVRLASSGE